jgi:nucleoside-diphosphate-sugar epimerase
MTQAGRVVVYGGRGALGSKCISTLKANNFWVGSIDLTENSDADLNIVLEKDSDLAQQVCFHTPLNKYTPNFYTGIQSPRIDQVSPKRL